MITRTTVMRAAALLFAAGLSALTLGCSSSTEPATSGQIVLYSEYSRGTSGAPQALTPEAIGPTASGVDSIVVTRARLVLRDIKFKTQSDSANFRTSPFVLALNLNGSVQSVSAADVPFGTYQRIEFDVHKILSAEVLALPVSEQLQFQDFLFGGGQSVVIEGRVYKSDGMHTFTFYSALNTNQKIELAQALVVSSASPVANVTMKVMAGDWFNDSHGGLLDPTDPSEETTISHNISGSIHAFKDTNRDGNPD